MAWFRWYEGASSDPKFHLIARKSGQPVACALAVWACLLERASEAEDRGDVSGFDCESADAALGMPEGATQAIVDAMAAKGMIADGRIANWEKRQPRREDEGAAERKRAQRAREKEGREGNGHAASRDVTNNDDQSQHVTQCHAASRDVTTDEIRREENIKNILNTLPYPSQARGECGGQNSSSALQSQDMPGARHGRGL